MKQKLRGAPRRCDACRLAALASLLFLASCASVQKDVLRERAEDADFRKLAEIEEKIAAFHMPRAELEAASLSSLRAQLPALRAKAPLNAAFAARAWALEGELERLSGRSYEAGEALASARSRSSAEEWVYVLGAFLSETDQKKEQLLLQGQRLADTRFIIGAELGMLRQGQGRYREAVAAFDQALPGLTPAWRAVYEKHKKESLERLEAEGAPQKAAVHIGPEPIHPLGMTVVAQEMTGLLDFITGGKTWAAGTLCERLAAAGYFGPGQIEQKKPATRAQASLFLWRLLASREGSPALLRLYSDRYAKSLGAYGPGRGKPATPVADLAYEAWYFDSALGCVEREILSLPDGKLFYPERSISGSDFLRALRKVAE